MINRTCLIFFLVPACLGGNGQSRLAQDNEQTASIRTGRFEVPVQVSVPVKIELIATNDSHQFLFGNHLGHAAEWAGTHKKRLLVLTMLLAYAAIQWRLLAARLLMRNQSAWCNWQDPLDAQALNQMPPDVVYKLLTESIALRYDSRKESFVSTIGIFFADVDAELSCLRSFVEASSKINALHASWLFAISPASAEQANMRVRKLVAMRRIIVQHIEQVKRALKQITVAAKRTLANVM